MSFVPGSWVPVQVRSYYDLQTSSNVKVIVVGGEGFDWDFDPDSVARAKEMANGEDFTARGFEGMIRKHFQLCFSEFIGRLVTIPELVRAIKEGGMQV